jgi:N-carbamoylputrescine amidase
MDVRRVDALPSLCPAGDRKSDMKRIALVQMRWYADATLHRQQLTAGVAAAADAGAEVVFLPELTLSRYPADTFPEGRADQTAEPLEGGPTHRFAAELAARYDLFVHASLFEHSGASDGRGLNTAIIVSPAGQIVAHTRKLHIPVTAGYYEDQYFAPGNDGTPYPVHTLALDSGELPIGLPTCWDEWFPEVARCYALAGAGLLAYPTAIGSEPDYPAFDTEPLLRQVIVGHAIANGLFIAVPNRFGDEGTLSFYGSSFIVDPFGRTLAEAPRDREMVLVADIDLGQRRDWLTLFPFLATRRPDTYESLVAPVRNPRGPNGDAEDGGIPGVEPR